MATLHSLLATPTNPKWGAAKDKVDRSRAAESGWERRQAPSALLFLNPYFSAQCLPPRLGSRAGVTDSQTTDSEDRKWGGGGIAPTVRASVLQTPSRGESTSQLSGAWLQAREVTSGKRLTLSEPWFSSLWSGNDVSGKTIHTVAPRFASGLRPAQPSVAALFVCLTHYQRLFPENRISWGKCSGHNRKWNGTENWKKYRLNLFKIVCIHTQIKNKSLEGNISTFLQQYPWSDKLSYDIKFLLHSPNFL